MGALTWLDGGLATALQKDGLPPFTPVDGWLREHPERLVAAHRAFVEAGAEIVLAGTFRAWRHPELAAAAVRLARAGATRDPRSPPAAVWASVGPGPLDELAAFAATAEVDGIVLETFVDPGELAEAVRVARRAWAGPLVASLVPSLAGPATSGSGRSHASPADLAALVEAGADGVGFNCGSAPEQVLDAIERAGDPGVPLWARPAGGPRAVEVLLALAPRCRWIGGCCGVSPDEIASARARHG